MPGAKRCFALLWKRIWLNICFRFLFILFLHIINNFCLYIVSSFFIFQACDNSSCKFNAGTHATACRELSVNNNRFGEIFGTIKINFLARIAGSFMAFLNAKLTINCRCGTNSGKQLTVFFKLQDFVGKWFIS